MSRNFQSLPKQEYTVETKHSNTWDCGGHFRSNPHHGDVQFHIKSVFSWDRWAPYFMWNLHLVDSFLLPWISSREQLTVYVYTTGSFFTGSLKRCIDCPTLPSAKEPTGKLDSIWKPGLYRNWDETKWSCIRTQSRSKCVFRMWGKTDGKEGKVGERSMI